MPQQPDPLADEELTSPPPKGRAYAYQLARAARLLDRIRNRTAPSIQLFVEGLSDYEDDLWSFFMHCWHIRDWVRNDPTLGPGVHDSVVAAAEASPALRICADLANGVKHLVLKRHRVGAAESGVVVTPAPGGKAVSWDHNISLANGSVVVTAWEVAQQAMRAWRDILSAHDLPLPSWLDEVLE